MTRRARSVATLVLAALALVGCSSDGRPATKGAVIATPTSVRETATSSSPGQASSPDEVSPTAPTPAPGSPSQCFQLAASKSLLTLGDAFAGLADPARTADAANQLHSASADLRTIAEAPSSLQPTLIATADSIDALAATGLTQAGAETVQRSVEQLGVEVQTLCLFPLD